MAAGHGCGRKSDGGWASTWSEPEHSGGAQPHQRRGVLAVLDARETGSSSSLSLLNAARLPPPFAPVDHPQHSTHQRCAHAPLPLVVCHRPQAAGCWREHAGPRVDAGRQRAVLVEAEGNEVRAGVFGGVLGAAGVHRPGEVGGAGQETGGAYGRRREALPTAGKGHGQSAATGLPHLPQPHANRGQKEGKG